MHATAILELFDDELVQKLADSRRELLAEDRQPHAHPWIIGYSGGKDSTLVVHLVMEMLMALPRSERLRRVHIVANDTLVESPLVVCHIKATMARFDEAAAALRLPAVTQITAPKLDHGFWVNLIGRDYPAPSRSFRWCTDRMKIQPTSDYIKAQASQTGEVILLLGERREHNAARASRAMRDGSRVSQSSSTVAANSIAAADSSS